MATFVLVHGAWHGGWCWARVAPLLRDAGHDVYTPTLTGHGERAHLLPSTVDLETNVRDVLAVLTYEDLMKVVLVGHSYGGMIVTAVAERMPGATSLPRTYIGTDYLAFRRFAERARTEPGWHSRHLPSGHDAMITMPRELVTLLLEIPT